MRKLLSFLISMILVFSISVSAFATTISSESEQQSVSSEIVYTLESRYCIEIPERIYASDGDCSLTAQFVYLQDDQQISVYISPMKDPGMITLSKADGDTLDLSVNYVDGNTGEYIYSTEGLVAVFTDSSSPDGWMRLEPIFDGKDRGAGEYSGTFEFTIQVESRE